MASLHPYYLNNTYCITNINMLQQCETNKYELFQLWCYPNISTNQLRKDYPNLSWRTVIELSLVYHPIRESISFYDSFTLTFYSIRDRNSDMAVYFYNNVIEYLSKFHDYELPARGLLFTLSVCLHCYKYNVNIFDRLLLNKLRLELEKDGIYLSVLFDEFRSAMRLKYNENIPEKQILSFNQNDYYLSKVLYNTDIFTPEELCELIIIMNIISNNTGIRTSYLGIMGSSMEVRNNNEHYEEFLSLYKYGSDIGISLGINQVTDIWNKYYGRININITKPKPITSRLFPQSLSVSFNGKYGGFLSKPTDIVYIRNKFPQIFQLLNDPFQRAVLSITYGKFDEYFKLRDTGFKFEERNYNIMQETLYTVNGDEEQKWQIVTGLNWGDLEAVSSPDILRELLNNAGGYLFNSAGFISMHVDFANMFDRGFDVSYLLNPIDYNVTVSLQGNQLVYGIDINENNIEDYYSPEDDMEE